MSLLASAAPQSRNILLAEDEPDLRDTLGLILEFEGWAVTAVGDGQAAVDAALHTRFHVAVLDVAMPILDGLLAAELLRATHPRTRIVMHTGIDEHWVRKRFLQYDDYFRKPMDPEAMVSRLMRLG